MHKRLPHISDEKGSQAGILITGERKDYNESFTPEVEAEYFYDYQYYLKNNRYSADCRMKNM
jgi:hypothetical protein